MARPPRYHLPGGIYHIIFRGNNRQDIFFERYDYIRLIYLLEEGVARFGHRILAYCFMKNHIHLAVQAGEKPISKAMQNLSFRYTRYVNKKKQKVGHLFQGRFKSFLVDGEGYLKTLIRYIHLNPVRAKIVDSPEKFEWSSHNAYLGRQNVDWLHTDYYLKKFSDSRGEAIARYEQHTLRGIGCDDRSVLKAVEANGLIGGDDFLASVQQLANRDCAALELEDLIDTVCTYYNVAPSLLSGSANTRQLSRLRSILSYLTRETEGTTLQELASFLDRHPNAVSRQASTIDARLKESIALKQEISGLFQLLGSGITL